jgi:hypothetical protein
VRVVELGGTACYSFDYSRAGRRDSVPFILLNTRVVARATDRLGHLGLHQVLAAHALLRHNNRRKRRPLQISANLSQGAEWLISQSRAPLVSRSVPILQESSNWQKRHSFRWRAVGQTAVTRRLRELPQADGCG